MPRGTLCVCLVVKVPSARRPGPRPSSTLNSSFSALSAETVTYTYDAAGNRTVLVDPDNGRTTGSYDSRNVLSYLVNPQNERTTWQYDAARRVTTMTCGNGSLVEYDYDAAGRTTALRNLKSDRSVISILTYSYDDAGTRTGVQEANGDRATWSYDNSYQLTREQRSGANAYDVTYTYDGVANRLTKLEGGTTTTYSYDDANQLTVEYTPSQLTTYTYDANGNTTVINAAGSLTTNTWDLENRNTKIQMPGAVVNTFTYDGDGSRRRIEDSAGLRNLIWDTRNILAELDNSNNTLAAYTLAPHGYGSLLSQRRSGATSYHHYDALGSTDRLTDAAQAAVITYLYRGFGQQSVLSGASANPFTWLGRMGYYRQADAGNYWVRARTYQPSVGRFLSLDPIGRGLNLYVYVNNRVIILVDPSGLRTMPGGAEKSCAWIREPNGSPRDGYWCCECPEPGNKRTPCVIQPPPMESGGPQQLIESTNVTCGVNAERGARCSADFRVSQVLHRRTRVLSDWRTRYGKIGRLVQDPWTGDWTCCGGGGCTGSSCAAAPVAASASASGEGGGGKGGGGRNVCAPNVVMFWVGDLVGDDKWWHDLSALLDSVDAAMSYLRDNQSFFTVPRLGRHWDDLRKANKTPNMWGLYVAGHGSCQANPLTECEVWSADKRPYNIRRPGKGQTMDWQPLDLTSRGKMQLLTVMHCMEEASRSDAPTVEEWFTRRLHMNKGAVEMCDYYCYVWTMQSAVWSFAQYFVWVANNLIA